MAAERALTQDDYVRLAVRLYHELVALRERARVLPYDRLEDRLQLSLRATEIGAELRVLTDKSRRHTRIQ